MSGACVADGTLPEHWELLRFHVFLARLRHERGFDQILGRTPGASTRELLESLSGAERDRLLLLLEQGSLPMRHSARLSGRAVSHLASHVPSRKTVSESLRTVKG